MSLRINHHSSLLRLTRLARLPVSRNSLHASKYALAARSGPYVFCGVPRRVTFRRSFATGKSSRQGPDDVASTPPPDLDLKIGIKELETALNFPIVRYAQRGDGVEHPEHQIDIDHRVEVSALYLINVIAYLSRPRTDGISNEQYLLDFEQAPAEPDSELYRARAAVIGIIRNVVFLLDSIPASSPIRAEQKTSLAYDTLGALIPLHDMYLPSARASTPVTVPPLGEWAVFWSKAQPVVVTLGQQLATILMEAEAEREAAEGSGKSPEGKA